MSSEQRGEFMLAVVVPRMRPLFQEFDGEQYAEFGCPTCHGANAREVGFEMPNGVHPLDPTQIPAMFESEDTEVRRIAHKQTTRTDRSRGPDRGHGWTLPARGDSGRG